MPEEKSFAFSTSIDPETAADYMEALARQLRSGSARLASAGSVINFEFGSPTKFDLEAGSKQGLGTIKLELSWKEPVVEDPNSLTIQDAVEKDSVAAEPAPASVPAEEN